MAPPTLVELYIARTQHRVVQDVIKALACVKPTDSMDHQLTAVAQQLKQPAPDINEVMFEHALGDLVSAYATTAMDQARSNVRAMHRGEFGGGVAALKELDPDWHRRAAPLVASAEQWRFLEDMGRFVNELVDEAAAVQAAAVQASPEPQARRCMVPEPSVASMPVEESESEPEDDDDDSPDYTPGSKELQWP